MKIDQFMVPATCEPSSIADSNIRILKPDENHEGLTIVTNAKDEEDVSILVEFVSNKESSSFSLGLKSEVNNAYSCFDAGIFDKGDVVGNKINTCNYLPSACTKSGDYFSSSQEKKEHVENRDACFSSGSKSEVIFDNACKQYDAFPLLEDFQYSNVFNPNLNIDISTKDNNRANRGDNAGRDRLGSKYIEYFLPSQKFEYAKKNVDGSIDESKVYNEAWLFGKILRVIMLQEALGLKFNSEGVDKDYQCYFKLMEHLPLFRRGSYFSLSVNGHV